MAAPDWQKAAELLNGMAVPAILSRLKLRSPDEIASLHQGALDNPRVSAGFDVGPS